jgi:TPR repeat protein
VLQRAIGAIVLALSVASPVRADTLGAGIAAVQREDYVTAARLLGPLAERGVAVAQFYMCFMYYNGRGVPQSYDEAAIWCFRSAEQGHAGAQYQLGLMYDRGHGVPENWVEAHKWLNLAAGHAPRKDRASWVRVRNAVASKMTLGQLGLARQLAVDWRPKPER